MPKLAATLASLLLIASSIGVNIARYPQVGRMAEPGSPVVAEPANSPQTGSQAPPHDTPDAEPPHAKTETAAEQTSAPPPAQPPPQAEFATLPPERPVPTVQADVTVPIVDVRPMAPVANLNANSGESPRTAREVRRLPAVDSAGSTAADFGPTQALDVSAFPTTSTP